MRDRAGNAAGRQRRADRAGDRDVHGHVLLRLHEAHAHVAAPALALEVGHHVERLGLLLQREFAGPVVALERIAVGVEVAPACHLFRADLPRLAREVAAEAVAEVARVRLAAPARKVRRRERVVGPLRPLVHVERLALVLGPAIARLDVLEHAARRDPTRRRPAPYFSSSLVEAGLAPKIQSSVVPVKTDVLLFGKATSAAEPNAVQAIAGTRVEDVTLEDVLHGGLALAFGRADLAGDHQPVARAPLHVEVVEARLGERAGTIDLVHDRGRTVPAALANTASTSVPFCTRYDVGMRLSPPMTRLPQNIQLRL